MDRETFQEHRARQKKILGALVAAGAALVAGTVWGAGNWTIERGQHVGHVVRLSNSGIIYPTREGEIASANIKGGRTPAGTGNTLHFSVQDAAVDATLQKAMNDGTVVKVGFRKVLLSLPWKQTARTIITSVEPVETAAPVPVPGVPPVSRIPTKSGRMICECVPVNE